MPTKKTTKVKAEEAVQSPPQEPVRQREQDSRFDDRTYWEGRVFEALKIIIIGIIFLLNTTGYLSWNIWINILRFWPLFIISAGISIIFSGVRPMKFVGAFLNFILFLGMLGLALLFPLTTITFNSLINPFHITSTNANRQQQVILVSNSEYSGVEKRDITIETGYGTTLVKDNFTTDFLSVDSVYYSNTAPELTKNKSGSDLSLKFTSDRNNDNFFNNSSETSHTISVGQPLLLTDITYKLGAGTATVQLDSLHVRNFITEVGAGNMELTFAEDALPRNEFQMKAGVGSIKLTIPNTIGYRLQYKVGLGALQVNGKSISAGIQNGSYDSSNYNTAATKVTIDIQLGLGNIEIITK